MFEGERVFVCVRERACACVREREMEGGDQRALAKVFVCDRERVFEREEDFCVRERESTCE